MKEIKAFKLTNGELVENKATAERKQLSLTLYDKLYYARGKDESGLLKSISIISRNPSIIREYLNNLEKI